MTYYPDLSPCGYFDNWEQTLVAVGWLEPGQSFTTGPVPETFLNRLVELTKVAVQKRTVGCMMGFHRCGICKEKGLYTERALKIGEKTIQVGQRNLFVPGSGGSVYVAPSLIIHYIVEHQYCPPEVFQEAVMGCPRMGSLAY